jgi:leucyl aminopeptidase
MQGKTKYQKRNSMMTITVTENTPLSCKATSVLFFVPEGILEQKKHQSALAEVFKNNPHVLPSLEQQKFSGKAGSIATISGLSQKKATLFIFVGLGKQDKKTGAQKVSPEKLGSVLERYRRTLGLGVRAAQKARESSLACQLPTAEFLGVTLSDLARETATTLHLATYHFDEFITDSERKSSETFDVTICVAAKEIKTVTDAVKIGEIIGRAANKARHWVDLPPTMLTPVGLTDKARDIAKQHKLDFIMFDEKEINEMGMGGLAAVSRGSELDCHLIIMSYKTKKKNAPTLALVGKGITFDSGGLSLKPSHSMETMKEDMSGAAAVIASMEVIAQLKPDVHVVAVAPLAENLPSGNAVKPGDIVRFYNGKTAEIKNTDAEGRLILADALSYTVKHYKPDAIIDLATLTGACAHALGPFFSGLMSQHDDLAHAIEQSAMRSGDRVWRLPMNDDYKPAIRSEVADISNTGNPKYMAGTITAGFFLKNFVDEVPWVHLDIAGTAFDVPDIPYYRPGATGVGVRLLVDLVMNWHE